MKILHYASYESPYRGNFMQSLSALSDVIKNDKNEICFIFPTNAKKQSWTFEMQNSGEKVDFLDIDSFASARKLNSYLKENNIDVLHVHFIKLKILAFIWCALWGLKKKVKYVIHMHNHMPSNRAILRQIFTKNAVFCCCSESVAKSVCQNLKISDKRVFVAENAIDFSRLDVSYADGEMPNCFETSKYKIMMFGFDYKRKGVDVVLDAIDKIKAAEDKLQLYICLAANKDYIQEKIIERYNKIPQHITILSPTNEIGKYYKAVNCFISASREEGFCYALIEAAYCKDDIIASKIPAQKDLELPLASFFENENSEELALIINENIKSISDNNEAKEVQKNIVVNHYKLDEWAKKVNFIYL